MDSPKTKLHIKAGPLICEEARRKTPHQQRIEEFMRKAEQNVPDQPTLPDEKTRLLRAKLILEEALETVDALGIRLVVAPSAYEFMLHPASILRFEATHIPNLQELVDGCADVSVVTIGTLSACGIADVELLEEVDRSNLAKFELPQCPWHGDTMLHSMNGAYRCTSPVNENRCGHQTLGPYRNEDGRWIKGPDWKPPDIEGVLKRQMPLAPSVGVEEKTFDVANLPLPINPSDWEIGKRIVADKLEEEEKANPIRILLDAAGALDKIGKHAISNRIEKLVEELVNEAGKTRVRGSGVQYDSGGLHLCPYCKGPLSDSMMESFFAGRILTGWCSNCVGRFSISDYEKAANAQGK